MSDERDDERIREPPALEGEVLRWHEELVGGTGRVYWHILASDGSHFVKWQSSTAPDDWEVAVDSRSEAVLRLAAELAACRARRDEGDTDALKLLDGVGGALELVDNAIRRGYKSIALRLIREQRAAIDAARRAAATATSAGEETER